VVTSHCSWRLVGESATGLVFFSLSWFSFPLGFRTLRVWAFSRDVNPEPQGTFLVRQPAYQFGVGGSWSLIERGARTLLRSGCLLLSHMLLHFPVFLFPSVYPWAGERLTNRFFLRWWKSGGFAKLGCPLFPLLSSSVPRGFKYF